MSAATRLNGYSFARWAIGLAVLGITPLLSQCSLSSDVQPPASSPRFETTPLADNPPTSPVSPATPSPATPPIATPTAVSSPTAPSQSGQLRVSNQTNHAVRVVMLSQQSIAANPANASIATEPIHWDFAPQEGSAKGLLLSSPKGSLLLQPGDVLMAFAEDGSRRYWGPYVIAQTATPVWDTAAKEWVLILQP